MSDTLTLYKLILLHILDKVSFPMSNGQLSEFMLDKEYTDYFTVQTALSELVEAHFLHLKTVRNTSFYSITGEGQKTLEFFGNKISSQIQDEIEEYLKEHKYELRNEVSVPADYYPTGNGEYAARCRVLEKGSALIDLTLTVPTREQAESICANWSSRSKQIYAYLMQNLL